MREMLFRWKDDEGNWEICREFLEGLDPIEGHVVMPKCWGQYSGIDDKNGKKIFEGDMVAGLFQFGMPFSAVCVFKNGAFGVEWKHGDSMHYQPFAGFYGVEWEIVGNIWDDLGLKEDNK